MPSHPAVFLAGETRQVWALRRDTGAPVYLVEGAAKAMRPVAKAELRCLYPGCDSTLSTRGGSKRDHFFHVGTVPHETGRETENHLAAKAMLGEWLKARVPEGATVRVEETVKNPKTALHRRPDVMATGATGRRIAYEVEYKAWSVGAWCQKQQDLDGEGILCVWLIGHTRLRQDPDFSNEVRVPLLLAEIARHGSPLVVVNPATREIGTLTNPGTDDVAYDGHHGSARLHVDVLEDCRFSSAKGIRTPAMLLIEATARRRAETEADRERQRESWSEAWEESLLRPVFAERWGTHIPQWMFGRSPTPEQWRDVIPSIGALEKHWRSAIYEDLVRTRTEPFRMGHVLSTLKAHGIAVDTGQAGPALYEYMKHLSNIGLLTIRDRKRRYALFPRWEMTPTGRDPDASTAPRPDNLPAPNESTHQSDLEARRRTKPITMPDGSVRWVRK